MIASYQTCSANPHSHADFLHTKPRRSDVRDALVAHSASMCARSATEVHAASLVLLRMALPHVKEESDAELLSEQVCASVCVYVCWGGVRGGRKVCMYEAKW